MGFDNVFGDAKAGADQRKFAVEFAALFRAKCGQCVADRVDRGGEAMFAARGDRFGVADVLQSVQIAQKLACQPLGQAFRGIDHIAAARSFKPDLFDPQLRGLDPQRKADGSAAFKGGGPPFGISTRRDPRVARLAKALHHAFRVKAHSV